MNSPDNDKLKGTDSPGKFNASFKLVLVLVHYKKPQMTLKTVIFNASKHSFQIQICTVSKLQVTFSTRGDKTSSV